MNYHYHVKLLGILGLLACGAPRALAQQPSCPTNTLDVYINSFTAPGNGCLQGAQNNVENYGFTFETRSNSGQSDVSTNITVNPDNPSATLAFSGFESFAAGSGLDIEYFIGYNIDPPPILTGDSISLDPFNDAILNLYVCPGSVNGSNVTGTPYFLGDLGGTFECGSTFGSGFSGGTLSAINLNSPTGSVNENCCDPMTTVSFSPTSQVGLLLELQIDTPPNGSGLGSGTGTFGNDPVQSLPEPSSLWMLGSGLVAAVGCRKFIQNRLRAR